MPWIGGCDLKRGVAAWIPAATVASGGTAWMGACLDGPCPARHLNPREPGEPSVPQRTESANRASCCVGLWRNQCLIHPSRRVIGWNGDNPRAPRLLLIHRASQWCTMRSFRGWMRHFWSRSGRCREPAGIAARMVCEGVSCEDRMGDALSDYMHAISRIPLLTASEEVHLATIIRTWQSHPDPSPALQRRGRRARDRMVQGNLRLVVSICKRYHALSSQSPVEMLDLVQAGSLGLIRAVQGFDPGRGYKFSTYAYWWIRQSVTRQIKERGQAIRVPPEISALARRVQEQRACDSRPCSLQGIAAGLGVTVQRLEEVLRIHHLTHLLSLDQVCGASRDGDQTLLDLICGDHAPAVEETYDWLHRHLRELRPAEQRVLDLRYNREQAYSFAHVASLLGLKKSQVQWLEKHALSRLRRHLLAGY